MPVLRVLVVDGRTQARRRWRALIEQCAAPAACIAGEAHDAVQALALLRQRSFDLVLLDEGIPGGGGLALARALRARPEPVPVVLVCAQVDQAVHAFDADVTDFLLAPVRPERLQQALRKVQRLQGAPVPAGAPALFVIEQRDQALRLPLHEVVYFKAEAKYVTVRTVRHRHLFDGSLADLQARHGSHFLRVHRNALAALRWMRALERTPAARSGADAWRLRFEGVDETLAVSRRHLASVRARFRAAA